MEGYQVEESEDAALGTIQQSIRPLSTSIPTPVRDRLFDPTPSKTTVERPPTK